MDNIVFEIGETVFLEIERIDEIIYQRNKDDGLFLIIADKKFELIIKEAGD